MKTTEIKTAEIEECLYTYLNAVNLKKDRNTLIFITGQIVDDEMNALLVQQLPRGSRLTAIFDSCHSATALDLPNIYDCNGQPKKQKYSRKTAGMDLLEAAAGLSHGNIFDKLQAGKVKKYLRR